VERKRRRSAGAHWKRVCARRPRSVLGRRISEPLARTGGRGLPRAPTRHGGRARRPAGRRSRGVADATGHEKRLRRALRRAPCSALAARDGVAEAQSRTRLGAEARVMRGHVAGRARGPGMTRQLSKVGA
jgi:hypothetical protein